MKRIKENSREKEPFVILSHSFSMYYSHNYFPDDKKKICRRKKNAHWRRRGSWGICTLIHNQQLCEAGWAGLSPLSKEGHSWQVAEAGLLKNPSCPMLIHSPLEELERCRAVPEYKPQTNITIQNSNSPLLLNSMEAPGWLKPQQTHPLDKNGKDGGQD